MSQSIVPYWTHAALGVLTGLGAGYMIAHLATRRWYQQPTTDPAVITALNTLTAEVARLRETVNSLSRDALWRRGYRTGESSVADFVSAQSGSPASDSDDEFYDITATPGSSTEDHHTEHNEEYFDDKGTHSQESEEVASSLMQELQNSLVSQPNHSGYLWRLARVLVHLSLHKQNQGLEEQEKQLLQQAADTARKSLDSDDGCWQAHQWYATAIGSMSKFQATQQKIEQGNEYKEHIEKAISLNPDSPLLHYLRGRWCYEVSALSWFEKKAAAALYGTPPESTYQETLECFTKAEELGPGLWKSNELMIAKCHLKLGDNDSALEWLHKANTLPTTTPEDEGCQREIEELLTQQDQTFSD